MADALQLDKPLPVGSSGKRSGGWWGMMVLIATEGSLFAYLLFSYFYLASQTKEVWPPGGLPVLLMPGVNTVILLASSGFVWICEYFLQRSQRHWSLTAMSIAFILGTCFVAIQLHEWKLAPYDITTHLYGSLFFTITGFHMLHVIIGLGVLMMLWVWIWLGYFNERRYAAVTIGGLYWHFVDIVWLFVFSSLYLWPYLYQQIL